MAQPPTGLVPPVSPDGSFGGKHHVAGMERYAAQIVEDADLLAEVLRRAALICPDAMRSALRDADARFDAIRTGGYVERFGGDGDGK